MKRLTTVVLFSLAVFIFPSCKSTFNLTDEIKGIAANMTPEEAAEKLGTIIDKEKTSASIGLEDVITGGSVKVCKDSVTFFKTIVDKSASSGFATGYQSTADYTESRNVVITVQFSRVKSIKMHEAKNRDLKVTIKDGSKSILAGTMFQFETAGTNRELAISLCSKLMPDAEFVYTGGGGK